MTMLLEFFEYAFQKQNLYFEYFVKEDDKSIEFLER